MNKYIKCIVEQDYLGGYKLETNTNGRTSVILYGDVDNDGDISVLDASLISQYLVGKASLTDDQLVVADVDGDGSVSVFDVRLIQQYLIGSIDHFPVVD